MIDEFDYKEPRCVLCDGKSFYAPNSSEPLGHIDVRRVLEKADACFARRDMSEAGRLLEYWRGEAAMLRDESGELSVVNELIGFYRKRGDRERAFAAAKRALELMDRLGQAESVSGGTVLINCATAYKAFGEAEVAMPLYRRAEAIYCEHLAENDARRGGLYNNMALALADLGAFEEAEAAYRSALSVMEAIPRGEAEAAITYVNLAHLYESMGQDGKVVFQMTRAYACLKSETLPHDGYFAFVCEKCAPSFGHFGFPSLEKELCELSEAIYARS